MHPSSFGPQVCGGLAALVLLAGVACGTEASAQSDQSAPFVGFAFATGAPRSLIALQLETSEGAKVIWDPGAGEQVLPTGLGGTMFSVPLNAKAGPHTIVIEDETGARSEPLTVLVEGDPLLLPYPRIDHIMPLDPAFNDDGTVTTTLYVQGANFDIGAVVKIDGVEIATVAHKAILNNLYGVPQAAFDYPIQHYVALAAVPAPRMSGDEVPLTVRNLDGKETTVMYTFPESQETLDSDGDSLLDAWEATGYDGTADGMSDTDPYRKDIFVELDIMTGLQHDIVETSAMGIGTFDSARAMFASAPFINPYTANGINLVLDVSGSVPAVHTVVFVNGNIDEGNDNGTRVTFAALKAQHFNHKADGDVYHYAIWAQRMAGENSGISDMPEALDPLLPGDDFLIGLDALDPEYQSPRSQVEILAHELGHDLGQRHGGATDEAYNPNYLSVMSYTWALRAGLNLPERRLHATCFPFYYATAGEGETHHQPPSLLNTVVDYSAGMARAINESSVQDTKGVCDQPVDWEPNMVVGDFNGAADVNRNGVTGETLKDFANWRALMFDGPRKNGTIIP